MGKGLGLTLAIGILALGTRAQNTIPALKVGHSVELSGGYDFDRFRLAGTTANMKGLIGAIGINVTRWMQLRGDASVELGNFGTSKLRIYGDHFGPRLFFRKPNGFHAMPFAEVLLGASRLDAKLSGASGYSYVDSGFSMKAGGGLDFALSSRFAVRAVNLDYYMTPFFGERQNNLWVSSGFVIRFGASRP